MLCPVCNKNSWKKIILTKDFFLSKENFQLIECLECGFIITENPPEKDAIGKYYKSENYISHSDTHKQSLFSGLYKTARSIMLKKKYETIRKHKPHGGTLVDIGCGTGYFLNYMKTKNWECMGVEQDKDAADFATKNFGLQVLSPDYYLNNQYYDAFDVITLWHVLEHLYDLHAYLLKINQNLKSNGILILALPNPESFDANYFKEYWAAWDVPRHLWHFKKNTLVQLMRKYNFELSESYTMPFDLFYVTLLSATYKNNFKWIEIPYVSLMGVIQTILNKNKCSSLTYIFKKKN